jgi:hypothetical protein
VKAEAKTEAKAEAKAMVEAKAKPGKIWKNTAQ